MFIYPSFIIRSEKTFFKSDGLIKMFNLKRLEEIIK